MSITAKDIVYRHVKCVSFSQSLNLELSTRETLRTLIAPAHGTAAPQKMVISCIKNFCLTSLGLRKVQQLWINNSLAPEVILIINNWFQILVILIN